MAGLVKFIYDISQLISPFFIKLIVDYIAKPKDPIWLGYLYCVLLFLINVLSTILVNQYFHMVMTQGMRIRTGLRAAIYRKSLRLSNQARQKMNTGDIVNFMSVDAQKICDLVTYLHMVWSGIFQIAVCLGFLFYFIGWSTLAGVAVMIIVIPLQGTVAKFIHRLRREMMQFAGERIKIINEMLMGIRVIKYYAWEKSFLNKVLEIRKKELTKIRRTLMINTFSSSLMTLSPLFVSLFTFALYALLGNELKPDVIFPALGYFNLLRFPLVFFPTIVALLAENKVSLKRLQDFLYADEISPTQEGYDEEYPIKIMDATFAWSTAEQNETVNIPSKSTKKNRGKNKAYSKLEEEEEEGDELKIEIEKRKEEEEGEIIEENEEVKDEEVQENSSGFMLRHINVKIKKGTLTAVVGLVGSGKSSFLNAIIGEMKLLSGSMEISTSIAYCPQQAWIQNGSVRENIVFGHPFDERRYQETIRACALQRDLEILPAGDETEIGEKGINLSGGQRQRISLARAVYSNANIYLLDDILSAVDAHVGKFIFEECITGLLKNKTIVLVTHQWQYLRNCDHVIVFKDGTISESGSYEELMQNGEFAETLKSFTTDEHEEEEAEAVENSERAIGTSDKKKADEKSKAKLMEVEERETGSVKFKVYKDYARYAGGYHYTFFIFLLYTLSQIALIGNSFWLAVWGDQTAVKPGMKPPHKIGYYMGIYFAFGAAAAILQLIKELVFAIVGLFASKNLHAKALERVLFAPTNFFDRTPLGRIINRFSKDIESVDNALIQSLKSFFSTAFNVVGVFAIIAYVTPFFLAPMVPVMILYFFVQQYYRRTSRELKRLDSISRSPLFAHFSETLTGISTIRAYRATKRFEKENERKLDMNNMAYFCQLCSQRWLSVRLEFIGTVILTSAAIFCVIGKSLRGFLKVDAGLAGLALSYALQITGTLNWTIRSFTETEAAMNSVERMLYYCEHVEQEAAYEIPEAIPPSDWPQTGNITFKDVFLRYRQDLDFVLKGISAEIYGSEKIGIVGRTGAGKSSLMAALFRLIELDKGYITIDGIDISKIGLYHLRSNLSIIPQDPVLFSGTIRFNLDPFDKYTDQEVWQALERAHMKKTVQSLPLQLSEKVVEYGENFSVGQRQLFCLARAILRQTKVLVLDEATASVDLETDALIQHTVRSEFADRTVLTIAHRLNTIIDSDRIMVLDQGELVEFDSPKKLLSDENSKFSGLCKQTGKQNFKYLLRIVNGEISFVDDLMKQLQKED
jgi:ATP-binding cassette subfamily C (CFTR/MRP) protein 1